MYSTKNIVEKSLVTETYLDSNDDSIFAIILKYPNIVLVDYCIHNKI